jgi:steroid delta-isomerase-like uncharacterized protein
MDQSAASVLPQRKLRNGMSEQNKVVLRRHFAEVWSQGNVALLDELFASDYLGHAPPDEIQGRESLKQYVSTVRMAIPDLQCTVEDQIAEADRVVIRWTARGTHTGKYQGIPPTGKQVTMTGMSFARIANGKIVESWTNSDALGMLQLLGVVPAPGQVDRSGESHLYREPPGNLLLS